MRVLSAAIAATLLLAPAVAKAQTADTGAKDATPADLAIETDPPGPSPITISGYAALVSQYRFRGISLSDEDIAVQGTINFDHESGLYAGVWASSTDGFGELGGSNVEVDLYAGYRTVIASGLALDAGLLYYVYPGSNGGDFEFFEPYANVSGTIGPATAKVGVAFAPPQNALTDNSNLYVFGDVSSGVPSTPIMLKAHLGWSKGDTRLTPSGDYFDWLVGADYVVRYLTFGVAYVDTDLGGGEAARGGATKDIVDAALVFSLTAAF